MATERTDTIANMTMAELKKLITEMIDSRKAGLHGWVQKGDGRPLSEVLESIRKNRIKPAPGQPSTLEMLREDRDR